MTVRGDTYSYVYVALMLYDLAMTGYGMVLPDMISNNVMSKGAIPNTIAY